MGRNSTYPTTIEDCTTLTIKKLNEWKYLEPNQSMSGIITWSSKGNKTACISIEVNTINQPFVVLSYNCNDVPIRYRVDLIQKSSNLGNGMIWYFVCPRTNKLCRKLYLINTYFYHRSAFRCAYAKQNQSKKTREMERVFGAYFDSESYYQQLYKKHFKKTYRGKPTKKYRKLSYLISKANKISVNDIEWLMVS